MLLLLFILLVSFLGWKTNNLSISGAVAATMVGVAVAYAFSWKGLIVLGVFFVTSSFWSRYRKKEKADIENKLAKTSKRDWQQVLANGGGAMILSILYIWTRDINFMLGAFAALAAANADTWASEIGPLSKSNPVSVKSFKRTDKGTSGAVSALGTFASLSGSLVVAFMSLLLFDEVTVMIMILITITGLAGSFIDTLLGAYFQLEYKCPRCQMMTEAGFHCGVKTEKVKGFYIINNEFVNFSASFLAGAAMLFLVEMI